MPDQPDATGIGAVGDDRGGLDGPVAGGLEGDGETATVRIGAGQRPDGLDDHGAQGLVEGAQGPHLSFDAGAAVSLSRAGR
ncbi:hypothetical protein OG288_36585 [Streptomyces tauricus]|uniref:Uncharacterized protein n=1 Tax=Streptomyces tauricus TaxID=68274 RepID=A0ABZ1JPW8_9ACTN|nr:hypothetical protein [Streptomyces tauricus]